MFVGCASGTPSKNMIKKASQALNDLSSWLRFCKQGGLRHSLGTFGLLTIQRELGSF
jgi:hypothetical protein